tara:strand:+ start:72 stop:482 length:411 start_codon:yes stop_codon:yes gene_type:complete
MKSGDKEKTSTLRMAINEIQIKEKTKKTNLDDSEIGLIVQSMIKQRKESLTQFEEAGRLELAQKENREIEILSNFLPAQLSKEEIDLAVSKALNDLKVQSSQDIGKVMGLLKNNLKGKADMSLVSQLVKNALNKSS